MKTYTVSKAFPGAALGAELQLSESDAAEMIASGHLVESKGQAISEVASDLQAAVKGIVQSTLAESLKSINAEAVKSGRPSFSNISLHQSEADKSKSFADFLANLGASASPAHFNSQRAQERLVKVYGSKVNGNFEKDFNAATKTAAVLVEGTAGLGGYLVPVEYSSMLLSLVAERSILFGKAKRIDMSSLTLNIPSRDMTLGASGASPYLSGMAASWGTEGALSQENPKFKQTTLTANTLGGYTQASRQLIQDNIVALEQVLQELIVDTITWFVDSAYFVGTGSGQPLGITASGAFKAVTPTGTARTTANTIKVADVIAMYSAFTPSSYPTGMWVVSQSALSQLIGMVDASGRLIFQPSFSPTVGPISSRVPGTLLGMPVFVSEKTPTLGTAGDIMLIDPSMYLSGVRADIEIAVSDQYAFTSNELTWRFLYRGDGRPWLTAPLTLADGATVISPFVGLHA